jgi:hypothetical protein
LKVRIARPQFLSPSLRPQPEIALINIRISLQKIGKAFSYS